MASLERPVAKRSPGGLYLRIFVRRGIFEAEDAEAMLGMAALGCAGAGTGDQHISAWSSKATSPRRRTCGPS